MDTIHGGVDDIKKKAHKSLNPPGPGTYSMRKTFGEMGMHKTFHSLLPYDSVARRKNRHMPGPGAYEFSHVFGRDNV